MDLIKNNWKLKLLSLIGAIVLWSFVISTENPTVNLEMRDIPVTFENEDSLDAKGLVLLNENRPKVNLVIRGPRNDMVNITPQHIKVTADLSGYSEGLSPLNLKYNLPKGIELVNEPSLININIQKIIAKKFDVEVELEGQIQEGYLLESTKATPEQISVKGPRSQVESISKVVAKLELNNLTKDTVSNVDIEALTKDGQVVDNIILGQNFVNIGASVKKIKEVKLTPLTQNFLDDDLKLINISAEPKTFMIKGDSSRIDQVTEIPTKSIDLSKLKSSSTISVEPDMPTDVYLVNEDVKFKVKIELESKVEKSLLVSTDSIKLTGLGDKALTFDKDNITVKIEGFETEIADINVEDIELSYNFTNVEPGSKNITPSGKAKLKTFSIKSVESVGINIE